MLYSTDCVTTSLFSFICLLYKCGFQSLWMRTHFVLGTELTLLCSEWGEQVGSYVPFTLEKTEYVHVCISTNM